MLPDLKDTTLLWMSPLRKSAFYIYWILLILFLSGFLSLFFIRVFVSVRAPGIITVSVDNNLLAECYVSTTDIIQLKPGQKVKFHLDAFGNRQHEAITGGIDTIESDFIILSEKPFVRVLCRMDQQNILIDKSFRSKLKKGMKFQARFITGSRTLWEFLFDTIANRLNPV